MHPFLLDFHLLGHAIRVPTYGFFLATGFTAAYLLSLKRATKYGDDPKHVENLFIGILVFSIFGCRLFHVLFEEPRYYLEHPLKFFAVWEGGYTLYGGIITSVIFILIYCRKTGIEFLHFADYSAPATALGIALGRLGCFFAGCCWGKPTQCFLGVRFSHPDAFTTTKVPVHPTQLYESFGCFLLFGYLEWRFRSRKYSGQIYYEGLLIYSVLRFIVELFRGDDYRGYIFGVISYSQAVSLLIFPYALWGILKHRKR